MHVAKALSSIFYTTYTEVNERVVVVVEYVDDWLL